MQVQEKIIAPKKPRKTAIKDSKKVLGKAMAKTPAKKTAAVKAPAKTKKTKADGALTLLEKIMKCLDDNKAEDIRVIPIPADIALADAIIIATGRSQRQTAALAHYLEEMLAKNGEKCRIEGLPHADWVLVDTGDYIIHIFRPEVREFYNLEKMWL